MGGISVGRGGGLCVGVFLMFFFGRGCIVRGTGSDVKGIYRVWGKFRGGIGAK